jgi:hypothetical protein
MDDLASERRRALMRRLVPLFYWPFFLAAIVLLGLGVFSDIGTSNHGKMYVMVAAAVLWVIGWAVRYMLLERGL